MTINRWHMNRALFYNFWYYPNQEFFMEGGKALFRGHNGSGKSVTTQMLITVLLDGDTRNIRLDPFSKQERNLRDTLLGEEGINEKVEDRIGYVVLEFKKGGAEIYTTIGIGIEASRKDAKPKSWFFILNGKRVGESVGGMRLYKEEREGGKIKHVPYSESKLREIIQIEGSGRIYSHYKDYADQVNKQLFGFETLENYLDFIHLLIQTRNPKLTDTANPDRLSQVLSDALPPIEEEEIRPMYETIETIQQMERDRLNYEADTNAMLLLENAYRKYHVQALAEKAWEYRMASEKLTELEGKKQFLLNRNEANNKLIETNKVELRVLEDELQQHKNEKSSLASPEIENLHNQIEGEKAQEHDANERLKQLEDEYKTVEIEARKIARDIEDVEASTEKLKQQADEAKEELRYYAEMCKFEANETWITHFDATEGEYSFKAWELEWSDYCDFLNNTLGKLREYDLLLSQLHAAKEEVEAVEEARNQAETELQKLYEVMEREQLSLIEGIQEWMSQLKELMLPEFVSQQIIACIGRLRSESQEVVKQLISDAYHEAQVILSNMRVETEHLKSQLENQIEIKSSELLHWETVGTITPLLVEDKKSDWNELFKKNIPFIPFYMACEFKDDISHDKRLRLQHVLSETGMLTSVIVPKKQETLASNYTAVLVGGTRKDKNLANYLIPRGGTSGVNDSEIEAVLASISVDEEEEFFVSMDGSFKGAWIRGKSVTHGEGLLIGSNAREVLRQGKIQKLQMEVSILKEEVSRLLNAFEIIKQRELKLEEERSLFPPFDQLLLLHTERQVKKLELQSWSDLFDIRNERLEEARTTAERAMKNIRIGLPSTEIPLRSETFSDAVKASTTYSKYFQELKNLYVLGLERSKLMTSYRERLVTAELRKESIEAEQDHKNNLIRKAVQNVQSLTRALSLLGADEIKERLLKLDSLIRPLPDQIKELEQAILEAGLEIKSGSEGLVTVETLEIPLQKDIVQAWRTSLDEHRLFGIYQVGEDFGTLSKTTEFSTDEFYLKLRNKQGEGIDITNMSFDDAAEYLYHSLRSKHDVGRNAITKATSQLESVFNEQFSVLLQYSLSKENIGMDAFEGYDLEDKHAMHRERLNAIRERLGRIKITAELSERRLPLEEASDTLYVKIQKINDDLIEKDRDLFEKFLMNSISQNIRGKIQYVKNWEKEINRFLDQDGMIRFRLKWEPKKPQNEQELGTKELVDMLNLDPMWVDVSKVAKHFDSKIKQAKIDYENREDIKRPLREFITDVLDYRKWYNFDLYFTKYGDKEIPLTKKTIAKLSGGQQVLSIVAPILAALHAKYTEARSDTVRLFTLDEAFARVDDENKEVMFEYIRNLDFDYIINSQEMWGTYRTVPNLRIFDLARPNNRTVVAVTAYHWNGDTSVKKRLMSRDKLLEINN
ncbi:SbcC/MukB-like Walker B domain-containing protein [Paenibacillus chitinolyticus]|uniref:SbcC/MukB-like Walker B domain-containing protein n=1 Tax=Paenibacillus chitinolyticus TaxID=79263 RepID=UPI002DBF54A8|nr:SbcC/MukB-like Walker B domain-containing protein [Paenibacillus chitinolyticus]MEC0248686.1 SbcC/MukB-like Walker B domain-containing protein [Paenibacillus chitinolyticus]